MNESRLFRIATALIALHIVDAELLEPAAGTSASDHLAAAFVPIAIAGAAAWVHPRLRPGPRAGVALVFGALTVAAGVMAAPLLIPVGVALVGLGAWIPWRHRGPGRWRNRVVAAIALPVIAFFGVVPVGAALWTTGKPRAHIGTFAVPHRDVAFTTSDGLRLSGWYVASHNGAAIVIVHGGGGDRDGARRHAAMLAHAGYGVLLYDARLEAGARARRTPTAGRGARTSTRRSRSSNGSAASATSARSASRPGPTSCSRPRRTGRAVRRRGGPRRCAPDAAARQARRQGSQHADALARAAHGELWRVDAGHTAGLREHPGEYTRRVVGFFDRTLLNRR